MNHLRFLRYIDEVARSGSIRLAAERLHIAPSAVNRRLQDIEEELGTQIFERLPRGMRLTAAGELFIHYIRSRTAELDQVRSQIEDLRGLRRGTVRLAVSQAVSPDFLPSAIASFRNAHPLVTFEVNVVDHVKALAALRAYDSDLALAFNLPPEVDVDILVQAEQKLLAVMHQTHPLAKCASSIRLSDCVEFPLALPDKSTAGRQLLERFLVRKSLKLSPAVESNSFEFLMHYLKYEMAITFQIAIGVPKNNHELVIHEIGDYDFPCGQLVLARLSRRQFPVIAHTFAEHLGKIL
jgi:DNA-binding transcriptional LysR family regulator